jgi:hypothetical protein
LDNTISVGDPSSVALDASRAWPWSDGRPGMYRIVQKLWNTGCYPKSCPKRAGALFYRINVFSGKDQEMVAGLSAA